MVSFQAIKKLELFSIHFFISGSPAPGPVGPAPPSDLNALLNGLGFGGGAAGGGNLQDLISLVNGGGAPAPDIITDVTLNCRVRRQEVGSAQECSTQTNGVRTRFKKLSYVNFCKFEKNQFLGKSNWCVSLGRCQVAVPLPGSIQGSLRG